MGKESLGQRRDNFDLVRHLGMYEPVLRTSAIAEGSYLALLALLGELVALVVAEFAHLWRCHKVHHRCRVDVTQFVFRLDEMVASVRDRRYTPARGRSRR